MIMKSVLLLVFSTFLMVQCTAAVQRDKRAACDSTYGDWSEWTTCDSDCGFCGTQTRTRVCAAVSGCTDVTCTGDASESQACSTSDVVCLAPQVSCCPSTYKKMVDIPNRRFYCGLV